ncbi:MAG: GNAT family N-acetyltransferase [Bacteroidota bacterium]
MNDPVSIRKATAADQEAIWQIIQLVIAGGDTYVFAPDSSKEKMLAYWCGADKYCYVAVDDNRVLGTFIIKDNFPDLGAHVANASYMTHPAEFGKGIGKIMGAYSLGEARRLGYKAMQFNIVVKRNERAVRLWEKLGFQTIGEVPEAFNHATEGLVNTLIMWRKL